MQKLPILAPASSAQKAWSYCCLIHDQPLLSSWLWGSGQEGSLGLWTYHHLTTHYSIYPQLELLTSLVSPHCYHYLPSGAHSKYQDPCSVAQRIVSLVCLLTLWLCGIWRAWLALWHPSFLSSFVSKAFHSSWTVFCCWFRVTRSKFYDYYGGIAPHHPCCDLTQAWDRRLPLRGDLID